MFYSNNIFLAAFHKATLPVCRLLTSICSTHPSMSCSLSMRWFVSYTEDHCFIYQPSTALLDSVLPAVTIQQHWEKRSVLALSGVGHNSATC